ncbi:MAG: hypothetical protein HY512_01420 [Candidatus Aenigmarchaeota archaeon]|nr:hypothetical protein [Candidatus Aenigmarchaeota archaeon]
MNDFQEGDNFRRLGRLEPHPDLEGVFVYVGSNLRNRSMAQILRDIKPEYLKS